MARDYRREYRAAVERARERGFASLYQQRRAPRILRGIEELAALPEEARASRSASAAAITQSRKGRLPLEVTGALEGVRLPTIRFWFPEAVRPTRRGRTRPTKADRYLRLRPIALADPNEVVFVPIRGSRKADEAIADFGVLWDFVHNRATVEDLERIGGHRYAGRAVLTDPDALERLANAGQFRIDEIYRALLG